jgi:cell division inhibitor SulA
MTRILKLQPEYRSGKYDRMAHTVPSLKLSGNWLREAGFHPSKLVRVAVEDNRLVITSIES